MLTASAARAKRTPTTDDDTRVLKSLRARLRRLLRRLESRIDLDRWDAKLSARIDAVRVALEALEGIRSA